MRRLASRHRAGRVVESPCLSPGSGGSRFRHSLGPDQATRYSPDFNAHPLLVELFLGAALPGPKRVGRVHTPFSAVGRRGPHRPQSGLGGPFARFVGPVARPVRTGPNPGRARADTDRVLCHVGVALLPGGAEATSVSCRGSPRPSRSSRAARRPMTEGRPGNRAVVHDRGGLGRRAGPGTCDSSEPPRPPVFVRRAFAGRGLTGRTGGPGGQAEPLSSPATCSTRSRRSRRLSGLRR
jgi:hypothetical protein